MEPLLYFERPGLLTTFQDLGRVGQQHLGIPIGGAFDVDMFQLANRLVGNSELEPVLEIAVIGPKLIINQECVIAITGALLSPKVNGESINNFQAYRLKKNDVLTFGQPIMGVRAYLAIAGKWKVKRLFQSVSPLPFSSYLTENTIKKGDYLYVDQNYPLLKRVSSHFHRKFNELEFISVFKGPEWNLFTKKQLDQFLNQQFTVSKYWNRMGIRLTECLQNFHSQKELITSGVVQGTVQITNEGQPILLGKDAQTTGGYYRIATVSSKEFWKLAHLQQGSRIHFKLID